MRVKRQVEKAVSSIEQLIKIAQIEKDNSETEERANLYSAKIESLNEVWELVQNGFSFTYTEDGIQKCNSCQRRIIYKPPGDCKSSYHQHRYDVHKGHRMTVKYKTSAP